MLKSPGRLVSIVPRKEQAARVELKVLDAYISHIALWSAHAAQNDSIRINNAEVAVSPRVAKLIHRFCNSEVPTGELEDLVTRCIALIAKCRTDLASGTSDSKSVADVYSRQAEMMLDVAVGTVVLDNLQEKCDELLATGNNDDAREVNQLQHETRNVVQQVRNSLNESEKARASELATTFQRGIEAGSEAPLDLPERSASAGSTVAGAPRPLRVREPRLPTESQPVLIHVRQASSRPVRLRSYAVSVVAVVILLGLAIYGVARIRAEPVGGDASESLMTAMSNESGITSVQDRMPYIVLTVHADFWGSSSDSQRRDWIKQLSRLAERHGYTGLVLRSTSGMPLAEWVRGRGIGFAETARTDRD